MPAAIKRRGQPNLHDFQRQILGNHPLAEGKNIAVVVRSGQACRFEAPAKGAANAVHFVGDHRFAIPRSAEHDAALAFAARHGFRRGADEKRIIHRVGAERAEILDFVPCAASSALIFSLYSNPAWSEPMEIFTGHSIGAQN